MVNLWIPGNNDFALNHKWLMKNFPPKLRFQSLILVDEVNVLRPEAIKYVRNSDFFFFGKRNKQKTPMTFFTDV